jgi:outer membrane protein OmpA-like peptidoglycan-associated protein
LGGKGEDDNYSFNVNNIDLRVVNYDDYTKKVMPGSKISLLSNDGIVLETKIADENGAAIFAAKPLAKYQLVAENTTYLPGKKNIQIRRSLINFRQYEELFLKRNIPSLTITVIDKENRQVIPNAVINISDGKGISTEFKDKMGVFRMALKDSAGFSVYASAGEYMGRSSGFVFSGNDSGEYKMTIELEKMIAGKQFILEDLYYDLDKYNIRPDAALVLDRLYRTLVSNPEIKIEIGSHTDCRATAAYNLKLSQRRSESVVAYLVNKGINPNTLKAKGYGESQLVNRCSDGVKCTEAEHQANRRTMIKIQEVK